MRNNDIPGNGTCGNPERKFCGKNGLLAASIKLSMTACSAIPAADRGAIATIMTNNWISGYKVVQFTW